MIDAHSLGWCLIHSLWQGALVALALAIVLVILRRSPATHRYAAAALALVLMIVLPLATLLSEKTPRHSAPVSTLTQALPGGPASRAESAPLAGESYGQRTSRSLDRIPSLDDALPWVARLWFLGVLALSLYHLGGSLQVRRLTRQGTSAVAPAVQRIAVGLGRRLGLLHAVEILRSTRVEVPTVAGLIRPVVLLPVSAFTGLGVTHLEALLAHELAHIRRHDALANLLQTVVETLLFYHPAMWLVSRQVRIERESCCDELAAEICGNRLLVARALASMEGLRPLTAQTTLGANGGSLMVRIRRLVNKDSAAKPRTAWLAVALFLVLVAVGLSVPLEGAASPEDVFTSPAPAGAAAATVAPAVGASQSSAPEMPTGQVSSIEGDWQGRSSRKNRVQVELTVQTAEGHWKSSFSEPRSRLQVVSSASDRHLELKRDAGVFVLHGELDSRGEGSGRFEFQGSQIYVEELRHLGYETPSDSRLFELALHDISLDFIRGHHALGYTDLGLDDLVELAVHDVSPEYVRQLNELGYDELPARKLVEFAVHDVSPEFIRELGELGYDDLPAGRLVEFAVHDVSPEFVHQFIDLGYHDLPASKLVEFAVHDVSPDVVRQFNELGYDDLSASTLVELAVHDVTPSFVRKMADRGLEDLTPDELMRIKIHGFDDLLARSSRHRP